MTVKWIGLAYKYGILLRETTFFLRETAMRFIAENHISCIGLKKYFFGIQPLSNFGPVFLKSSVVISTQKV